jgi:hypothetical protein
MPVCPSCGHQFDVGRFCTNCGHPVGGAAEDLDVWRTDTAERRAGLAPTSAPVPPPDLPEFPRDEGPRFPLYADEATTESSARSEQPWLAWAVGALALLLVAGLGAWLLFSGDDSDQQDLVAGEPTSTQAQQNKDKPAKPKKKQTREPPAPGQATDVATRSTATVPATAAPGTDLDGNVVRYEARNMLDGVPTTCWRMPGDGSGRTVTLALPEETELTRVGLINGYAKTDTDASGRTLDWYAGNRRLLSVQWVFDDGTAVTQDLGETRKLQTLDIDPVTTSSVELRLVTVTPPGTGPARRNYTAVSDLALVGTPA